MGESESGSTATVISDPTSDVGQKKRKTSSQEEKSGHRGPSEVWNHFRKDLIVGTKKYSGVAHCNYCHIRIDAPSSKGTNPLWHHLRKKCKHFPGFEGDKSQTVLSLSGGQPSTWVFDQERCRNSLARMIIIDELPFSIVEKEGFRMFCSDMQPKFYVVCRTTITKDCMKMALLERNRLKEYFNVFSPRVCITTDMWTSCQNLGYMVITAHFVDKEWKLQKKIISFKVIPHPHKGEVIAKVLESCLLEWGLDKVMTITLDNAKNNDTCVVDLRKRLNKRNSLLVGGDIVHVRCLAHVINLVVKEGIDVVKSTIKRLRRSVKYVRSSPSRLQAFKKYALEEKLNMKRSLCIDVKTRWNSTYLMIDAAMEYKKAFEKLEDQDPFYRTECNVKDIGLLNECDWKMLEKLQLFLVEFYNLTKRVSGSKYVTSNTYFDELMEVKSLLMEHVDNYVVDDEALDDYLLDEEKSLKKLVKESFHDMAKKMSVKFEKYCKFESLNLVLLIANVLDPRNKERYVSFWYTKHVEAMYSELTEKMKKDKVKAFLDKLKVLIVQLYEHYKIENPSVVDNNICSNQDGQVHSTGTKRLTAKDMFKDTLKRKDCEEVSNDVERYLADALVEDHANFDILTWWKERVGTYHALAFVARDVLSIPVTSVASECAFSTAGRVLDPFRSSLTPTLVEHLVCTQDWLRSPMPLPCVEENLESLEELEQVVMDEMRALSLGSTS